MLNKNIKKELFAGLATVALFAPMALGANAHASDLDNAFSKSSSEQFARQGAKVDQERGQWAKDHASSIEGKDDWKAGVPSNTSVPNNTPTKKTTPTKSKSSSSTDGEGSYTPITNTNPDQKATHVSHTSSQSTTKPNDSWTFASAPKATTKSNKGNNRVAKQLRHYVKDIRSKKQRKHLVNLTHRVGKPSTTKVQKQLKRVAKYIYGAKNRHAYQKVIKQL